MEDNNLKMNKLTDDELLEVIGGANVTTSVVNAYCENCKATKSCTVFSGARAICNTCKQTVII